jgi:type IV pilus assembly protein PilM
MHSVRRLPAASIVPNLSTTNVADADAVRRSISEALSTVGGAGRNRHVTVVLPDAAVRVLLLDFDTLPNNNDEAKAIIRFRLKKTLPFDIEHSVISFDRIRSDATVRAIVAVSPRHVVSEYEQVVRDAGYEPGVVLPSVLATLGIVNPDRATLVVKIDAETTSMVLADATGLRLIRTLEQPGGTYSHDELLRGVHASLIYYEDTFGQQIANVYLAGSTCDPDLANALGQEFQVRVSELSSGAAAGDSRALLAGVEGALLQ